MHTSTLGSSDIPVSSVGLATGIMRTDRDVWEPGDENELIAAIHGALELGVTLIETAPVYGNGQCEELVGKALLGRREGVAVATKCGLLPRTPAADGFRRSLTSESIVRQCETSLRRLRTSTIDLYQCHWPDPDTDIEVTFAALGQLLDEGKIRAVGLAHFGLQRLADACGAGAVAALQTGFSLLDAEAADDLIPYCAKSGIAVLADDPLMQGLLSGSFDRNAPLSATRQRDARLKTPRLERHLAAAERLKGFASDRGWTLRQLAVAWVTGHPGITTTLVHARRPSEVRDAVTAAGVDLTDDDRAEIQAILAQAG